MASKSAFVSLAFTPGLAGAVLETYALAPAASAWHLAPLPEGPGAEVGRLAAAVGAAGSRVAGEHIDVAAAVAAAAAGVSPPVPVVVTGSFLTVAAVRAAGL